tara:strand:+ start:3278 stop:3592 length:315 start_codon:yes stop_codon:yes gene_type:complete
MLLNYKKNKSKIDWTKLCFNFYCCNMINLTNIHLFEEYINWSALSKNPNAIDILENNLDKIDWCNLSENRSAIHLLKNNQDKIDWYKLSKNYSIFKLESIPNTL